MCAWEVGVSGVGWEKYINSSGNYLGREKNSSSALTSEGLEAKLPSPPFLGNQFGQVLDWGLVTAAREAQGGRILWVEASRGTEKPVS